MSRILAYTSPARGHLFPLAPILDQVRERRHEAALCTLASETGLMTSRGFTATPIAPAIERLELDN